MRAVTLIAQCHNSTTRFQQHQLTPDEYPLIPLPGDRLHVHGVVAGKPELWLVDSRTFVISGDRYTVYLNCTDQAL